MWPMSYVARLNAKQIAREVHENLEHTPTRFTSHAYILAIVINTVQEDE